MLAYAASRPVPVERRPSPNAMLAIVAVHVAVIAVVMSAKMDLPIRLFPKPTTVVFVPSPKTETTDSVRPDPRPQVQNRQVDRVDRIIPTPAQDADPFDPGPISRVGPEQLAGGTNVIPEIPRVHDIVKLGPTLLTSASQLRPPYPASKIITEEEATLKLRLTIDDHGRVVAVDPVGRADPVFLAAARKHLIANWRYRPATEDGRAVGSSMVITLRFQLDG